MLKLVSVQESPVLAQRGRCWGNPAGLKLTLWLISQPINYCILILNEQQHWGSGSLCFEIRDAVKAGCNATGQAGEGQARGTGSSCPFGRPGLPMVPSCQTQAPVASTVWALGMVQDLQDMEMCCETLALNPSRHQKAHAGIVSPALSKTVCLWMRHGKCHPGLQTDCLLVWKLLVSTLRTGLFLGMCLFSCILEER